MTPELQTAELQEQVESWLDSTLDKLDRLIELCEMATDKASSDPSAGQGEAQVLVYVAQCPIEAELFTHELNRRNFRVVQISTETKGGVTDP